MRPACADDAAAIVSIFNAAWAASLWMVPKMHTTHEDAVYFASVIREQQVFVAEADGAVRGFIAITPGWINHLYVHPAYHARGIGSALLKHAKTLQHKLTLWTFQANGSARRFYEAHGFRAAEFTDGSANEERTPDVRYAWKA